MTTSEARADANPSRARRGSGLAPRDSGLRREGSRGNSDRAKSRRPPLRPRGSLIAALDIGTTKVSCLIARVEADEPRVVGIGHQLSRGLKNGTIVDLEAASAGLRAAVHDAEQMAGEEIRQVVANLSGGFSASRIVKAEIGIAGREVGDADLRRVLAQGYMLRETGDRQVVHSVPVGFSIDDSRGIRDPRGMFGERLGVEMHLVGASAGAVRNQTSAIGRAHLELDALVVSPYASGLGVLVEDEIALGVSIVDMGGGTTTIGVFFDGNLIFADSVPVGGCHVTNDIARGLSTPLAHAERLKTLYGSAIASLADERESLMVPQVGEDEAQATQVPKSLLVGIIAPRLEETFELVRSRLEASGFDKLAGRRIVLTGGACQLQGIRELAALVLDKQVRIGRPRQIAGLAETTAGPAFATSVGLLQFALSERAEVAQIRPMPTILPRSLLGRVGHWLRENF
jgi:cell division protein FtsA